MAAVWAPLRVLTAFAINEPIIAALHAARPTSAHQHRRGGPSRRRRIHPVRIRGARQASSLRVNRKVGTVTVIVAEAMVLPRVYVAAEYIRDILAGLILNAAIGSAGFWAASPGLHWLLTRAERSRLLRALLTAAHCGERACRRVPPSRPPQVAPSGPEASCCRCMPPVRHRARSAQHRRE